MDAPSALRVAPAQERSRRTVERLLEAAVELLEEGGADALTTSALAARAQVRIRTVYRYFEDRRAVLVAVAERLAAEQEAELDGFAKVADPAIPWHRAVTATVEEFAAMAASQPAQGAVRAAMRASPALRAVDLALDRRLAGPLALALRRRGARASRRRLREAAATFLAAATGVLDHALLDDPGGRDAAVRELARLAEGYLGSYLPGG